MSNSEPLKPAVRPPGRESHRTRRYHAAPKPFQGTICAPPALAGMGNKCLFKDRSEAGRKLAESFTALANDPKVLVIAVPRGGIVAGAELAHVLNLPLNIWISRKLRAAPSSDLAFGSVAEDGDVVIDEGAIKVMRVAPDHLVSELTRQRSEVDRCIKVYREICPVPEVEGKTVIVVDDGLTTGATVRPVLRAMSRLGAARRILAIPVAPPDAPVALAAEGAECTFLHLPANFSSIKATYESFEPITDNTVLGLLHHYQHGVENPAPETIDVNSGWAASAKPL